MIIRKATHDDIPRIVEMAERFYASTDYPAIGPASKASLAGLAIITMESGVMLVAQTDHGEVIGMACLFIEPFTFNPSILVASELAWWIEPEHRGGALAGRMMRAIENECHGMDVNVIRMATLRNSPPQAAAIYERMGYAQSDSHYMRAI